MLDTAQDHDDPKGTWVPGEQGKKIDGYPNFENQDQADRFEWIRDGMMQLSGKIHCDLFQQDKPLLPGVSLSLKFTRSRTAVAFTAADANKLPKVAIKNPKLFIRKYVPTVSYLNSLSKYLLRSPAVYHFERVQMRQMTINVQQQFAEWPNLVTGQLPKMMLVTMTRSNALIGSHDTNPLFFHNFDLMHLAAEIDGKIYPTNGYEMDYSNGHYLPAYDGLCRVLEILNDPQKGLSFNRFQFAK